VLIYGWQDFSLGVRRMDSAMILGMMSLAAAPLATAPLAIAWNRHR